MKLHLQYFKKPVRVANVNMFDYQGVISLHTNSGSGSGLKGN